jgi:hypothetical protein
MIVETSHFTQNATLRLKACNRLWVLKNSGVAKLFSLRLIRNLRSSDFLYAVTGVGASLLLRNRTSRFRFCTVAAR